MRRYVFALLTAVLVGGCAGPPPARPVLDTGPDGLLVDEPLRVAVSGLEPGSTATVWARMTDDQGRPWTSWGVFAADGTGRVDLARQAPTGGSYSGTEPEGLLWSMRLPDGAPATDPRPALDSGEVAYTVGVDVAGRTVARDSLVRRLRAPGVRSLPVAEDGLVGDLYLPPGDGPHPGVVLLGGSEGGRPNPRLATLLAGRGFATLGLAYFGVEGLPPALGRIPVEYGTRAVDWLRSRPEVGDGQVGVVGHSKGGEFALLLGSATPHVGAVASVAGSGVVFGGIVAQGGSSQPVSSWTRGGVDVPPLTSGATANPLGPLLPVAHGRPLRFDSTFAGLLDAEPALDRASIPVEDINGEALLVSGQVDELWPSSGLLDVAARRLGDRAEHVVEPGAGHFILDVPNLPTTYTTAFPLVPGLLWTAGGGTPRANAAATADTFRRVVGLFEAELGGQR
ncbi:acyl-CoA thioester hydrolase/bile acid acetyltransferase-like protein [Saccharopolyspora erythraea NRRL 2338]|uniref:Acyl coenzyme A thioester hydrolase n=2 Tax=Saccharopolyspora erythraea TaxID=1836 RepID=A4F8Y5_SACEN|nr:acyl-CoA thioesterase/BAAT N-terminal domain-containing protein [Saccharopolyspora erythraea]PFG94303.1 acyl-CoA thioester hydrolase/bile acid acetyltransferase-like protein [Saccharopolyspora erythraea NRRL 2338]QRK91078.1 acyl-CoA thioesterase/BAAT N-terminal domain-containing protein [Saccharopolyspora erythraea]CAM00510.1 putative acyl coenzyme A thioester hydrolase [Saccharopolyspora erythraea NRRL 2338]